MSVNMICPTECPSCGEYDRCANNCVCPACHIADNENQREAVAAWIELSPAMLMLTAAEIDWRWSKFRAAGRHHYGLVIEGDEESLEINRIPWFMGQTRINVEVLSDNNDTYTEYHGTSAEAAATAAITIVRGE